MTATVQNVLDQLRQVSTSEADKGDRFERLLKAYFKSDAMFADQFSEVYLWQEWPDRGGQHDTGIDLVAVDKATGGNVAIQAKFYAADHHVAKADIDSFLSASGKSGFTERIIVSTGADWGPNAEATLKDQQLPVRRIGLTDLENSTVDWKFFSWNAPEVVITRKTKTLRPHQRTAVDKVNAGFVEHDRGKLIMACGTGKTFTALRLAEEYAGRSASVLFLVPSISLLSQTVREWANEADVPLRMLAICSDPKVTKRSGTDYEDISAVDLALPATTNLAAIQARWAAAVQDPDAMTVVFSTYQSLDVVAAAQSAGGFAPFDLIVCDEAHRTTGVTVAGQDGSAFVKVHDDSFVAARKRLYMTATPRLFGDDSKKKAAEGGAVIASMDDDATYGPELHRLGFGEAVEKDLLTDYRVLVLAVDEQYVARNFQQELADSGEIPLGDAAKIVGCWNGMAKHFDTGTADEAPMRRAVAFARDIKASKAIAGSFPEIVDRHIQTLDAETDGKVTELRVEALHVDGTFNALERNQRLDWLKAEPADGVCRVLTNARCLSEGVDVPSLDAVVFLTPRGSEVDVVQSVGRVMRKAEGKDVGYIILPIVIPSGVAPEVALRDNEKYKVVWQVLQALRAHDDRFNATVNQIDLNKKRPSKITVVGVPGPEDGPDGADDGGQTELSFDFAQWQNAIYAKIVAKVGERPYWADWAANVAEIAEQLILRIKALIADRSSATGKAFTSFLDGLRGNLNEGITAADAVEMLAQHVITRPIFQSFFGSYDFANSNPVAQTMERMLTALDKHSLDVESISLERFYASVNLRLDGIDNIQGRQEILVELYDNFFAKAFKRRVDKLGIVYTPVEIVDFILRSADEVLRKHFDQGLTDEGVHILDGFTGTGTFLVRLLQLGLIEPHDLARKYASELHANEILLLAYYIAAVNIESAYREFRRQNETDAVSYEPFPGLVLTDTFQSYEDGDRDDLAIFPENNERIVKQRALPITVIVGNPPYSAGQDSANDNNPNDTYPSLDEAIRSTYAARSTSIMRNSLYDSYIRAIKWATLRIEDRGVIALVTNGGWLETNAADGMRLTLAGEFSDIYVYNLRGNARTAGVQRQKEGGTVFGAGSRATVAITVLVRDPKHVGPAVVHYCDVGDHLNTKQKLVNIARARSVYGLQALSQIEPNRHGDWLSQRRDDFQAFIPLGHRTKRLAVFGSYSSGLKTNRDAWVYNSNRRRILSQVDDLLKAYGQVVSAAQPNYEDFDSVQISWSRSLRNRAQRKQLIELFPASIRRSMYRPFFKQFIYFDHRLNDFPGTLPTAFPYGDTKNIGYALSGPSSSSFSLVVTDSVPDLHLLDTSHFFARWRYEKSRDDDGTLIKATGCNGEVAAGYRRIDNITDAALAQFVAAYGDAVTKDDIFFYVYGLLHSPDYRETYAANLKKMLPRIPLVTDPWPFVEAGRTLSQLHLDYEAVDRYLLDGLDDPAPDGDAAYEHFRVEKMKFASVRDPQSRKLTAHRSAIVYNSHITLRGIPEAAYRYMLGSRSAIEWIIDRYQVKTDKPSGIVNDPNDWSREVGDPRYIIDLLARIVTVSLRTTEIVDALPPLDIRAAK